MNSVEKKVLDNIAAKLSSIGMTIDQWDIDLNELSKHPDYSTEVDRTEAVGVVGVWGEDSGGKSLILNGHIDVVPSGDESNWDNPPWRGTITQDKIMD